jgi:hypothetical protein
VPPSTAAVTPDITAAAASANTASECSFLLVGVSIVCAGTIANFVVVIVVVAIAVVVELKVSVYAAGETARYHTQSEHDCETEGRIPEKDFGSGPCHGLRRCFFSCSSCCC